MDSYINYVRALLAQGRTAESVRGDLLTRGLNYQTVDWLMQASTQSQPSPQNQAVVSTAPPTGAQVAVSPPIVPKQDSGQSWLQRLVQPSPATVDTDNGLPILSAYSGWIIVLLVCLLPTLIIIFDAPFSTRFGTSIKSLLTWGDIAGMIGLCLYTMSLVLATRIAWIEDLFGGLNKVYIAHAILGGSALMFILLHPVLIAIRYSALGAGTVFDFFLPTTKYVATAYGIYAVILLLILMIVTFYIHLPYRLWLWSHKCLALVYILICMHVLFEPNAITNNFLLRSYLILLLLIGLASITYRTFLPNILVRRYLYIIKAVDKKATGVLEITLTPTNRVIHFRAGQFVFIAFHATGLSPEWHPFTIVSAPKDGSFSIAVKSLGDYTETITRILPDMVGMSVLIEGAYGRFSFRNFKNTNQIWVAGGIGITPFLSMAQALGNGPYNIDLYYSVKSESELIDVETLARQQSNKPGQVFRVIPYVTEKYQRFLTADSIKATSGDLLKRDFLICGPPSLMASLKKQLIRRGVKKYKIHTEEFNIT